MFSEVIADSNIIEVINEEVDEGSVKLMLRVKDQKRWAKMMKQLLLDNVEEDDFGLAVNKSYWVKDGTKQITYCWVLIIWGDLEMAVDDLKPLLTKKAGPKRPPPSVSPVVTGQNMSTILDRRSSREEGVRRTATLIHLPHRRVSRNKNPGKTKKVGDVHRRGRYAYAEAIGGDEGNPW